MSLYIIDRKLTTTPEEKSMSGVLALVITLALIAILWFVHIRVPDPPFDIKQGAVELDFGMIDGGLGSPDAGGPSLTPPAQGGDDGGEQADNAAGGYGEVVTNEGDKVKTPALPPIKPPVSKEDPRAAAARAKLGKRGTTGPGTPDGWKKGSGSTGSGPGTTPGQHGPGTGTNPGRKGTGSVTGDFTNYKIQAGTVAVNADGEGVIACRVRVECNGSWSIVSVELRGTTYTGSSADANMRRVFTEALANTRFIKTGEICPETKVVKANIVKSY